MRRLALVGLVSFSVVSLGGALAGCGDNKARNTDGGTGGSGTGGTGGGDGGASCPTVSFVKPAATVTLGPTDDASGDACANGFQYEVIVAVAATNGTSVALFGTVGAARTQLGTTTAMGAQARFASVQLSSQGTTTLSVQVAGVACTPTVMVTVDCDLPTCTVSKPVSATLNGVPAPEGDRVSPAGSDFQAAFEVTTDIENGQPVSLSVFNQATPTAITTVTANAMSGVARFPGVTMRPDGTYNVEAQCTARDNKVGRSMRAMYEVDTTPPVLTVDRPMSGQFIGPSGLTNGAFPVCGTTTSMDAVNVTNPDLQDNLCVTRGQSTVCTRVTALMTSTCVNVMCPSGAAFDLVVTLYDDAGNPQERTITGVSCASTLPAVEIASPEDDAPTFADVSKRLLAASSTQTLKDLSAGTAGAQTNVIACTNAAVGAMARLYAGLRGGAAATQVGAAVATVAATAADGCTAGLGAAARFMNVTLPESTEAADGTLSAATEIRVDVTDASSAVGTSGATALWVDSTAPTLSVTTPAGLCGLMQTAAGTFMTDVVLASSTAAVTLAVTNGGVTSMFGPPAFAGGAATFTGVAFPQGANTVVASASESSGNVTTLPAAGGAACTVTVGTAPVVTFTTPTMTSKLCAAGSTATGCIADGNAAMAGWQGNITVHATAGAAPLTTGSITFTIGTGGTLMVAPLNASGDATLTGVTVPEGASVTITAVTDNIPGRGVGTASITLVVDTLAPMVPTALTVGMLNRRQTSFTLSWTAPPDNGTAVASYDIHVKTLDTSGNPCGREIRAVPFTGTPQPPGIIQTINVTDLLVEIDYCFSVAALDAAGNAGPVVTATRRENLRTTILTGTGAEGLGSMMDGTSDFGAPATAGGGGVFTETPALSDLLVGTLTGQSVYLYFGRATGYPTTPDVTITGPAGARFGSGVVAAGDVDGDGLADIAIGSPDEMPPKVYIFSRKSPTWGSAWPATLMASQANYVIMADPAYAASNFGFSLARLGNIDGVAPDDLAIGAYLFDAGPGGVDAGRVVIVKGSATFASFTLPAPSATASNITIIDGEATTHRFGRALQTLSDGRLVASASGLSSAAVGRVYAFAPPLTALSLSAGMASDITANPSVQYGSVIGSLGPLGPSPATVVLTGIGANYTDLHMASQSEGPFGGASGAAPVAAIRFTSSTAGNSLGVANIGSVVPATNISTSFIGDMTADLVLAGQADAGAPLYIINGASIATLPATVNLATADPFTTGILTVRNRLPSGWAGYQRNTMVLDLNGDGFGDFAVSEFTSAGRAVILW